MTDTDIGPYNINTTSTAMDTQPTCVCPDPSKILSLAWTYFGFLAAGGILGTMNLLMACWIVYNYYEMQRKREFEENEKIKKRELGENEKNKKKEKK